MARRPKLDGSPQFLSGSVREFVLLKSSLLALATVLPERTTLRQATGLAALLLEIAMGRQVTLTDLAASVGEDSDGQPIFGRSPERVMDKFRLPTRKEHDALSHLSGADRTAALRQMPRGWIVAVENEDDRRCKFLELTPAGLNVAQQLAARIRGDK